MSENTKQNKLLNVKNRKGRIPYIVNVITLYSENKTIY